MSPSSDVRHGGPIYSFANGPVMGMDTLCQMQFAKVLCFASSKLCLVLPSSASCFLYLCFLSLILEKKKKKIKPGQVYSEITVEKRILNGILS